MVGWVYPCFLLSCNILLWIGLLSEIPWPILSLTCLTKSFPTSSDAHLRTMKRTTLRMIWSFQQLYFHWKFMCVCVEGKNVWLRNLLCMLWTYIWKVERGLIPLAQVCAEGEVLKPSSSKIILLSLCSSEDVNCLNSQRCWLFILCSILISFFKFCYWFSGWSD